VADFLSLYRVREGDGTFLFFLKEGLTALIIVALFWGISLVVRYVLDH